VTQLSLELKYRSLGSFCPEGNFGNAGGFGK
jgi:hypothetical protein